MPTAQTYTLPKLGEALDYYWSQTKRKVRAGVVARVSNACVEEALVKRISVWPCALYPLACRRERSCHIKLA